MANNYEQITISPSILRSVITTAHVELLRACGFDCVADGADSLYVYCENGSNILSDDESYETVGFGAELAAMVKETPEEVDYVDILSDIIRAAPVGTFDDDELVAQGAFWCDRMRPGEFGGFVVRITPEGAQSIDTQGALSFLREVAGSGEAIEDVLTAATVGIQAKRKSISQCSDLMAEIRDFDIAGRASGAPATPSGFKSTATTESAVTPTPVSPSRGPRMF